MSSDANNNSDIRPWEDITAQDIEKLSPSAMRENNADYFLAQMYRTARDIVAYNYRGSITPDTEIHFGWGIKQRFGQEHRNFYIYQKGTIYLCNLYEMLHILHQNKTRYFGMRCNLWLNIIKIHICMIQRMGR